MISIRGNESDSDSEPDTSIVSDNESATSSQLSTAVKKKKTRLTYKLLQVCQTSSEAWSVVENLQIWTKTM